MSRKSETMILNHGLVGGAFCSPQRTCASCEVCRLDAVLAAAEPVTVVLELVHGDCGVFVAKQSQELDTTKVTQIRWAAGKMLFTSRGRCRECPCYM